MYSQYHAHAFTHINLAGNKFLECVNTLDKIKVRSLYI